mgnify:CR=1 FL=1
MINDNYNNLTTEEFLSQYADNEFLESKPDVKLDGESPSVSVTRFAHDLLFSDEARKIYDESEFHRHRG